MPRYVRGWAEAVVNSKVPMIAHHDKNRKQGNILLTIARTGTDDRRDASIRQYGPMMPPIFRDAGSLTCGENGITPQ